ncbi:hypothetical protein [Nostoc sp.]|uniref:hypothetical protein n=1 Tax=Nostoc sp. TaxID=1180 RepID=UPI002FF5CB74
MRLKTQVKQNSHCAIFSRNYSEHLDEAVEISNQNPRQLITFRSSVVWSSAKKAIETHGQRKIYFATVGDSNLVRMQLAQTGGVFQFVNDEPDIYSLKDGEPI